MTQPHYIDREAVRKDVTDRIAGIISRAVNAFAAGAGIEARATPEHCKYTAEACVMTADDLWPEDAAPMEAVAWRYRESADQDWTYEDHTPQHTPYRVGRMRRTVFPDFQALAVIPTHGGGE